MPPGGAIVVAGRGGVSREGNFADNRGRGLPRSSDRRVAPVKGIKFQTNNTLYTLSNELDGTWLICGHDKYCPTPTRVRLARPITVGERVIFQTLQEGPRKGKVTMTTPVVAIYF